MSTKRFNRRNYPFPPRDTEGRRICRWCGKLVPKGRLSWCSQKCVDDYLVRNNAGHVRRLVFERDNGVCAICGVNAEELRARYRRLKKWADRIAHRLSGSCFCHDHPTCARVSRWRVGAGWPKNPCRDWWDADHIVPVCEGGGECGLENYRTLCVPCHKRVTAELASKRALERRTAKQPELCLA